MPVSVFTSNAVRGIGHASAGRVLVAALQVGTSLAVARFLEPRDFGIVAFALVYINFLSQFSDFGITQAVVQRDETCRDVLNVAFTMKVALSALLWVTGMCIALAISLLGSTSSGVVLAVLSTTFLISTISFVPNVHAMRSLDHKVIAFSMVVSAITSFAVTVSLLYWGLGYWAIVSAYISAVIATAAYFNWMIPSTVSFAFDTSVVASLVSFGWPLFLTGVVYFFVLYGGNFVVGAFLGPENLGFYAIAFTFSFMIVNQVGGVIVSVLFPVYSRMRSKTEELHSMFLGSIEYTAAIAILLNVLLIELAEPFFLIVLGDGSPKWLPALAAFEILCFAGMLAALLFPVAPLAVALGRSKAQLVAVGLSACAQAALIVPAARLAGIRGVAIVVALAWVIQYFVYVPMIKRELGLGVKTLAGRVAPAVGGGLSMAVVSYAIDPLVGELLDSRATISGMLAKGVILICTFFIVHGLLDRWRMLTDVAIVGRRILKKTQRFYGGTEV